MILVTGYCPLSMEEFTACTGHMAARPLSIIEHRTKADNIESLGFFCLALKLFTFRNPPAA